VPKEENYQQTKQLAMRSMYFNPQKILNLPGILFGICEYKDMKMTRSSTGLLFKNIGTDLMIGCHGEGQKAFPAMKSL